MAAGGIALAMESQRARESACLCVGACVVKENRPLSLSAYARSIVEIKSASGADAAGGAAYWTKIRAD